MCPPWGTPQQVLFTLVCLTSLSASVFGYGVEGNPGLRLVNKLSSTRFRMVVGPGSFQDGFAKKPGAIQVVSQTDTDFNYGVKCVSVSLLKTQQDAVYPTNWAGPKFNRHVFEAELPADKPMKADHRYWVRINSPWLIGKNTRAQLIIPKGEKRSVIIGPRYGLREIYPVTPNLLQVMTGPGVDLRRLYESGTVLVSSKDDPDFANGVVPEKVGRRSNLEFYTPTGWPWRYHQRHEIFLQLGKSMKKGKSYTVDLNSKPTAPVTCGEAVATLKFDSRESLNLAIKVNQAGYLPDAPENYAYVGMWAGEFNAVDFEPHLAKFEVRDAQTHKVVHSGKPLLRGKTTYHLSDGKMFPDPKQIKGPETVYKQDLSYEDVYQLDLSPLKEEGKYYVAIPGMGRSFAFRIGADVYNMPFKTIMNGLFHQRCGIQIEPPYSTHFRPPCHRNKTEYSTFRRGIDKDPIRNLPKLATDGKMHDIWGGHHDAGDWNPRAHLTVAEHLFLAYELNRAAFTDGQLNIPENMNGIPDILDEANWALDLWTRLQREDGGVHHGIESNGDPQEGDSAPTDTLRDFAYAKDATGSYWFAAVAAHGSIIWKEIGKSKRAKELLARAVRAWNWAEQNGGEKENDRHVYAAAMLLRATGDGKYNDTFRKHSIFTRKPNAMPDEWQKHDQVFGSFHYARLPQADPLLKQRIVKSFESQFRFWMTAAGTTRYRYMRSPYAPNTWGTGGLPKWLVRPAMAMHLTQNESLKKDCRRWILLTNDFSLGCHPMNLVFTVGLGRRYVTTAFHHLQKDCPAGIIPGLQSEAAGGRFIAGQNPGRGGMGRWPGMSLFPPGPWPDLYKYSENASPGMNEGVTPTMAQTAFAYGIFVKGE